MIYLQITSLLLQTISVSFLSKMLYNKRAMFKTLWSSNETDSGQ